MLTPHPLPLVMMLYFSRNFSSKAASPRAFTLIELLVVISIIAVLAGILLPVGNSVITNSRKVSAKSTMVTVVNAIKNYQADYGVYPVDPTAGTGGGTGGGAAAATATDTTFSPTGDTPIGHNLMLFAVLRATNNSNNAATPTPYQALNARKIVYFEFRDAKSPSLPKDGFVPTPPAGTGATPKDAMGGTLQVGDLVDPWGDMYGVRIDTGYSDRVLDPYTSDGAGNADDTSAATADSNPALIRTSVIAWSYGKDHTKWDPTKGTIESSGNIASWK